MHIVFTTIFLAAKGVLRISDVEGGVVTSGRLGSRDLELEGRRFWENIKTTIVLKGNYCLK